MYDIPKDFGKLLDKNYIFDKNLSVLENEQKVEEYNKERKVLVNNEKIKLRKEFENDVIIALQNSLKIKEESAKVIFNQISLNHSDKEYLLDNLFEIEEMLLKVSEIEKTI